MWSTYLFPESGSLSIAGNLNTLLTWFVHCRWYATHCPTALGRLQRPTPWLPPPGSFRCSYAFLRYTESCKSIPARFRAWFAEILRHTPFFGVGSRTFWMWFSKLSRNVFTQLCWAKSRQMEKTHKVKFFSFLHATATVPERQSSKWPLKLYGTLVLVPWKKCP